MLSARATTVADTEGVVSEGVIEWVGPRHGELNRRVGRTDQTVVANVDQVVIVTSADLPPPKPHLIDRYIVATLAGQMEPVICMNKTDLDEAGRTPDVLGVYESLGYTTLATSAIPSVRPRPRQVAEQAIKTLQAATRPSQITRPRQKSASRSAAMGTSSSAIRVAAPVRSRGAVR